MINNKRLAVFVNDFTTLKPLLKITAFSPFFFPLRFRILKYDTRGAFINSRNIRSAYFLGMLLLQMNLLKASLILLLKPIIKQQKWMKVIRLL
jgi:hypothetical protein